MGRKAGGGYDRLIGKLEGVIGCLQGLEVVPCCLAFLLSWPPALWLTSVPHTLHGPLSCQ